MSDASWGEPGGSNVGTKGNQLPKALDTLLQGLQFTTELKELYMFFIDFLSGVSLDT